MKLNRKGYLTVEVILASVAAVAIAFFLMEITIRLVNITDDTLVDTELLTDKALIMENLKSVLEKDIKAKGTIKYTDTYGWNPYSSQNCLNIKICFEPMPCSNNYAQIKINDGILKYQDKSGTIKYEKKLSKNIDNWHISRTNANNYYVFKITGDNKFSKNNFEADIIIYNE